MYTHKYTHFELTTIVEKAAEYKKCLQHDRSKPYIIIVHRSHGRILLLFYRLNLEQFYVLGTSMVE